MLGGHVAGAARANSPRVDLVEVGRQVPKQYEEFVRRGAPVGLLGQARLGDRAQCHRHIFQRRLPVHHLIRSDVWAVRVEGPVARRCVCQQRPQREDIGPRPHIARRLQLLRRHEGRRTDDPPCNRQRLLVHGARNAEVDDAWALGREHDVRGLQVTVDDPTRWMSRSASASPMASLRSSAPLSGPFMAMRRASVCPWM